MRQYRRRQILASTGLGAAVAIAGCGGFGGSGTDTESRATPSKPQGNATVAASSLVTGSSSVNSLTSPVNESVSDQQFETLTAEYDEGFDLSGVTGEAVTIYVGEELGSAQTATVTDVAVDGDTVTFTLEGSITLNSAQQVVAEYGGVEMPERAGEYAVTVIINETASETGTITVEETAIEITSTFERTIEGWRVQGDAQGASSFPNYLAEGGNPGGHLEAVDDVQGGVWYWSAPAQFTGDKSDYAGGELTFDLYQSTRSSQFNAQDVILDGPEMSLSYDVGGEDTHPETDWTSYTVPLETADGWTEGSTSGEAATDEQFESVLTDLQGLSIRGEYVTGSDKGYLDNPTLVPPES